MSKEQTVGVMGSMGKAFISLMGAITKGANAVEATASIANELACTGEVMAASQRRLVIIQTENDEKVKLAELEKAFKLQDFE